MLTRTLAWGRFGDRLMICRDRRSQAVQTRALVIATGAYDRPVAFPGWTLPGVISAGGAQTLAKTQWVKPGQRMLLAGAGPFLLPVAQSLLRAGVEIVAIVEATTPRQWLPHAGALWGQWPRFAEAWDYKLDLRKGGVPTIYGHKIVRAIGERAVAAAVIARVDSHWRALAGTERTFEVDAIATGYGFLPNIELASSCGCDLRFDPFARAWFVQCTPDMLTSKPGIFVAGEITGIGGSAISLEEGRIAGLSAAEHVGALTRGSRAPAASLQAPARTSRPLRRHAERAVPAASRTLGSSRRANHYLPLRGGHGARDRGLHRSGVHDHEGDKGLDPCRHGPLPGTHLPRNGERDHRGAASVELDSIAFPHVRPPIKPVPISALLAPEPTEP